ncbi:hypothetical protein NQ318_006416 [Aromia moschata]|uniref:C3H1-type domain-containing protein n=1 Tax=Aromia moschata TaxID=1265417 RepID=A0AAV8X7T7_9CUCU|nr:hypothetical protein NQ318_006416 [Aromia moschata]
MDQKLMENSSCLQKQIGEYVDGKFEEMENKLVTVEEEFQNKFLEVERKIATLSLESGEQQRVVNTALKSPGSDIDRLSKPDLMVRAHGSIIYDNLRLQGANGWSLAEKATALTLALRGDTTDILQTLSLEEQDDYHQLVKHLEMRYGQSHLEHVYHSQLKNRYQKSNESLQEFEADIVRLVRLAYSSTPENVMERAVQAFLDGLRDTETRRALTLARPSKLVDALARALEFEAAKESCRRRATIPKMEEDLEEGTLTVVNDDWQRDELLRDQENDPNLKPIVNWKKEGRKPTWEEVSRYSPTVKSYWAQWNSLVLSDGLLKRVLEKSDGTEERKQLIVPRNRVPEVLEEIHNGSTGGHLGVTKTLGKFLHLFLLAYRSSVHETTGQTPASIVMGRELRLPCDLKFGCTPGDDVAGEDYGASDRMKETYDINANDGRYQPGNQVWLYNPQRRRGLSPKLQSSWEGPYEVVTRINDVPLSPEAMTNKLKPEFDTSVHQTASSLSRNSCCFIPTAKKARYGVTREEPRDLFQTPADFCLAHCGSGPPNVPRDCTYLQEGVWTVGGVTQTKTRGWTSPSNHGGRVGERESINSLAIPKIASGLDGLDWRVIRSMLEVLFRFTGIEILVCCYNPRRSLNEKTVDCFFYQTSRCKNGSFCRYRHGPEDDTIRDEMSLRRGSVTNAGPVRPCLPRYQPTASSDRRMWKRLERSRRLAKSNCPEASRYVRKEI